MATRYTKRVARRKSLATAKKKPPRLIPILRPLGAQVRRLRLERDLAQERLAELAGWSYKYLGRVELARANPSAVKLMQLAKALQVSVGELFDAEAAPLAGTPRRRATRRSTH